jgi:hypothetical protein
LGQEKAHKLFLDMYGVTINGDFLFPNVPRQLQPGTGEENKTDDPRLLAGRDGSHLFIPDSAGDEWSSYRDCSLNYIPAPFLNLLFLLPQSEAREGSPRAVWNYRVRKEIYDNPKWSHLLSTLEEKLKEIFPHSFLFQLDLSQIEYRNDDPRKISLETLDNLYHQILFLDCSHPIEGETCLAQAAHEAWLHTQTPIPHKWLGEIGDDFLVPVEDRLNLTWLMEDGFLFANVPRQVSLAEAGAGTGKQRSNQGQTPLESEGCQRLTARNGSDYIFYEDSRGWPIMEDKNGIKMINDEELKRRRPINRIMSILPFSMWLKHKIRFLKLQFGYLQ